MIIINYPRDPVHINQKPLLIFTNYPRDPVRVCDKCHEKIEHVRTPYAAKLINSLDPDTLVQTGLLAANGGLQASSSSSMGGSREGGTPERLCNGGSKNSLNIGRRSVDFSGNRWNFQDNYILNDFLPLVYKFYGERGMEGAPFNLKFPFELMVSSFREVDVILCRGIFVSSCPYCFSYSPCSLI